MVLDDEESEQRLKTVLREAAINSTLDHANVVTTYTYNMQPLGADLAQVWAVFLESSMGMTTFEIIALDNIPFHPTFHPSHRARASQTGRCTSSRCVWLTVLCCAVLCAVL